MFLTALEAISLCAILWGIVRWARKGLNSSPNSLSNLPGPPSTSFFKGNFKELFKPDAWKFHDSVSARYGSAVRIYGPLGANHLYVYDPKALNYILNKEQHIFEEATHFIEGNSIIFGKGLLSTLGDHHRKQRKMLNPVFSIAHMRDITPIFFGVARQLLNTLSGKVANQPREIEMKHWFNRMALELIGQSGLGYSFDPLTDDAPSHPVCSAIADLVPILGKLIFVRHFIYPLVYWIGTPRFQRFVIGMLPWKTLHRARDIVDILHQTSVDLFHAKKRALEAGDSTALAMEAGKGKDLMSVLMMKNMEASLEERLPDDEVLGQMSTFIFAATDTTSSALSRILYMLCKHPEAQERLREEILAHSNPGENLDYDTLSTLPYLDAVCRETLRLYPPIATLVRVARKRTILPLSAPVQGLDGRQISDLEIPAGTRVYIAAMASNRNKELWGDESALKWDPTRWLEPLPSALTEAKIPGVYSNLMTFLGGGRSCIGFKFSQLEMKAVLCTLLAELKFELPKDKEIEWNISVLATPSVQGDKSKQQLPLIVSKV